jgi:hypothetical protein
MQATMWTEAKDARRLLDGLYYEMRWRVLSLAADFDRLQRADAGESLLRDDRRIVELRDCIRLLLADEPNRAERVQMILSD